MKINGKKEFIQYLAITLGGIGVLVLFILSVKGDINLFKSAGNIFGIFMPIILGFVLAYLMNPLMKFIEKWVFAFVERGRPRPKLRRFLSTLTTYIIFAALLGGFLWLVGVQIATSWKDLESKLEGYGDSIIDMIIKIRDDICDLFKITLDPIDKAELKADIDAEFKKYTAGMFDFVKNNITEIANYAWASLGVIMNIFVGIILSFYFLLSKEKLLAQAKKVSVAFMKDTQFDYISHIMKVTHETFGRYITGKFLDSLIVGVLAAILLSLMGFPYVPILAVIIFVTNMIPFFGPIIGAVPCSLIVLVADPSKFIIYIIFIFALMQIDGNFIDPRIVGNSIGLDSIWVIIAVITMSGLLGVVGMFIGVPIFTMGYTLIKEKVNKSLSKKKKPIELDKYFPDP